MGVTTYEKPSIIEAMPEALTRVIKDGDFLLVNYGEYEPRISQLWRLADKGARVFVCIARNNVITNEPARVIRRWSATKFILLPSEEYTEKMAIAAWKLASGAA